MKQCSECGEQVSEKSNFCTHCGAPGPKKKSLWQSEVNWEQGLLMIVVGVPLGLVVLVGGLFLLDSMFASNTSGTSSTDTSAQRETGAYPDKTVALVMARSFVEKGLKSPGTANYGSVWDGTHQSTDDCVTDLGDGKYRVTGWVDSENAFGGTVRIDFVCELEYVGDDNWRCTDIQMDQR